MKEDVFDLNELIEVMKKNDIDKLSKFNNVGFLVTDNWGGLIIKVNKTGESVFVQEEHGDIISNLTECKLEKDTFIYEGEEYSLSEFIRK